MVGAFEIDDCDAAFMQADGAVFSADAVAGGPEMAFFATADEEFGPGDGDFTALVFSADHYEFHFHGVAFACGNCVTLTRLKLKPGLKKSPVLQRCSGIAAGLFAIHSVNACETPTPTCSLDVNKLLAKSQNAFTSECVIGGRWDDQ